MFFFKFLIIKIAILRVNKKNKLRFIFYRNIFKSFKIFFKLVLKILRKFFSYSVFVSIVSFITFTTSQLFLTKKLLHILRTRRRKKYRQFVSWSFSHRDSIFIFILILLLQSSEGLHASEAHNLNIYLFFLYVFRFFCGKLKTCLALKWLLSIFRASTGGISWIITSVGSELISLKTRLNDEKY